MEFSFFSNYFTKIVNSTSNGLEDKQYTTQVEYLLLAPVDDESEDIYVFRVDEIDGKEELNLVELSDEEGNVTSCEIYDIVEFEGKTYAMLLPVEEESEEEPELIVLEYVENGEEGSFVSIEDEEEFNKVCDYIESLMDEVEE